MKNIQYGTEFLDQLKDKVHEQQWEIERLKEENELLKSNPNFVYAMRNNKAIEYIESLFKKINLSTQTIVAIRTIERLLQGSDKE